MINLDIAFSSCPNDTSIFHAMLNQIIDTKHFRFTPHIDDVETLNVKAFSKTYHITKLSFYAYLQLKELYELLDSGSALGYGCGPLLIARSPHVSMENAVVAIPGHYTTAHLLLRLLYPRIKKVEAVRFDHILPGVQSGKYDAGLIIHEGRFVYSEYDCVKIIDLGEWWEEETGLPIPLGCIAIRKDQATIQYKRDIDEILSKSVQFSIKNPEVSSEYVKSLARELDDDVINGHINLYVNDFTISLGEKGLRAVHAIEDMALRRKIL